jgi:hypothetical protein
MLAEEVNSVPSGTEEFVVWGYTASVISFVIVPVPSPTAGVHLSSNR